MIEGFYSIAFTGEAGSGFGMIVFRGGVIAGADVSGAIYDGEYTETSTDGKIAIRVDVTIQAGAAPVQTGVPLAYSMTTKMDACVTTDDILSKKIVLLETTLGSVNVGYLKITRLPGTLLKRTQHRIRYSRI
jgi:hypothetical protein